LSGTEQLFGFYLSAENGADDGSIYPHARRHIWRSLSIGLQGWVI